MKRRTFLQGGLAVLAVPHARAADPYPSQTVRIIVASTPGTVMDTSARVVGRHLEPHWRQSIVAINQPGAGGAIGTDAVAKAAPDGHTLLVAHEGILAVQPLIRKESAPRSDIRAVVNLVEVDLLLLTHRSSNIRTVQELVEESRRRPKKLSYASAGPGTPVHLRTEIIKQRLGFDMIHVPYKSTPAGLTDLLGGQVDCMLVSIGPAQPHLADKLNVLATCGARRHPLLPDVPTLSESSPGLAFSTWFGLFAPAETPRDIVEQIARDVSGALQAPASRATLGAQGVNPVGGTPAQLEEVVRNDFAAYSALIRSGKVDLTS
jgi:tripartite-type tricarboxylate transporter receptor subunit TctC